MLQEDLDVLYIRCVLQEDLDVLYIRCVLQEDLDVLYIRCVLQEDLHVLYIRCVLQGDLHVLYIRCVLQEDLHVLYMDRCTTKGEEDYRPLFENFVQDLLSTVNKPEWPSSELLLSLLGRILVGLLCICISSRVSMHICTCVGMCVCV